jgi:5-bromo-4-chloroindolyl phosphate hydrolysis protein
MTLRLGFCLALLLFGWLPTVAQELVTPAPETNVSERVRLLESELERQNTKLDLLQKTLEEQQATIKALLEKLSAPKEIEQVRGDTRSNPRTTNANRRTATH